MPRTDQPTQVDARANIADTTMHYVYVGGVAYHTTEFINILARSSAETLRGYKQITSYFGPIWNFIDSVGVLVDAKKDAQNKDPVSAALNVFSGLQLISATIVGQIGARTDLPMAIGAQGAAIMSAGAFALCMFCSAAVAAYKEACLQEDIENLNRVHDKMDSSESGIIDRMILRNPTHKTTLDNLKISYFNPATSNEHKINIKERFTKILTAEKAYQSKAIYVWAACGIAMTIATLTLPVSGPVMMSIALVLMVFSGYARVKLREAEDQMSQNINNTLLDLEPKPISYFAEKYRYDKEFCIPSHNRVSSP